MKFSLTTLEAFPPLSGSLFEFAHKYEGVDYKVDSYHHQEQNDKDALGNHAPRRRPGASSEPRTASTSVLRDSLSYTGIQQARPSSGERKVPSCQVVLQLLLRAFNSAISAGSG